MKGTSTRPFSESDSASASAGPSTLSGGRYARMVRLVNISAFATKLPSSSSTSRAHISGYELSWAKAREFPRELMAPCFAVKESYARPSSPCACDSAASDASATWRSTTRRSASRTSISPFILDWAILETSQRSMAAPVRT